MTNSIPHPPHLVAREIDGGRFDEWTLEDFAAQCRMQSRQQLDPEFSRFMAALGARLFALTSGSEKHVAGVTREEANGAQE